MVTTNYFQWPEALKKLSGGVRDLLFIKEGSTNAYLLAFF